MNSPQEWHKAPIDHTDRLCDDASYHRTLSERADYIRTVLQSCPAWESDLLKIEHDKATLEITRAYNEKRWSNMLWILKSKTAENDEKIRKIEKEQGVEAEKVDIPPELDFSSLQALLEELHDL